MVFDKALQPAPVSFLACLGLQLSCGLACSPLNNGGADGVETPASGGASIGSGGSAPELGSGGAASGGSDGSGGAPGATFSCPAGYEGQVPTLAGATLLPIATAPVMDETGGDQNFLEGPVWANGTLYVSQLRKWGDQPPARILKLEAGALSEFIADSGSNGLALSSSGQLISANHKAFGLVAFDVSPAAPAQPIIAQYEGKGFNSPNDLTIRDDGTIYFTDPDYQCGSNCPQTKGNNHVYRVSPSMEVSIIASAHMQPNGIALSPDQNTLYVAGDQKLESHPVMADGSVGSATTFADVSSVDGLGVDCAGNVYVTNLNNSRVDVFTPAGSLVGSLTVGKQVTNVAFGGPENKTLYVTSYDSDLVAFELDIPGYPY